MPLSGTPEKNSIRAERSSRSSERKSKLTRRGDLRLQPFRPTLRANGDFEDGVFARCSNSSPIGERSKGEGRVLVLRLVRMHPRIRLCSGTSISAAGLATRRKGEPTGTKRRNPFPCRSGEGGGSNRKGQLRARTPADQRNSYVPTTPSPTKTVYNPRTPSPARLRRRGLARQRPFLYHPTSFRFHACTPGQISHENLNN